MASSNTDVAARQIQDAALRESEAKFRILMESAPDPMLVFNAEGRITLANRRADEVFGTSPGGIEGTQVEALMPERFRAAHREHRGAYALQPRTRAMGAGLELFALRQDGSEFPVEISLSPMRLGAEVLVIASIRDISERKRTEANARRLQELELLQSEHMATLGELAAGLAHEIKNPLAGIAAALEILAGEFGGQAEVMDEVRRQVIRIRGIVNELLEYARPRPLRMDLGNLNHSVARAVPMAAANARQRHVRVQVIPSPIPDLPHDSEQIVRLVSNLVLNAIQAVAENTGEVQVRTSVAGAMALIQVQDNGGGIPESNREAIFRPFFTTRGDGNGLGLPLCRRIAQMHGGRIELESRMGQGSTFSVYLPLTTASGTP
ncbi:MAG: two-component system sensor histidine kinase NtrB [Terriglobales bacterium]